MAGAGKKSSTAAVDPVPAAAALHSAAIHLLRRLRRSDADSGLSPARLSVLSILVFAGDSTPGQLARMEQVRPPTMTGLIQGLESDGLVQRLAHKRDGRALTIRATARGRRKLLNAQRLRIGMLSGLMQGLGPGQVRVLARAALLMERLAEMQPE